MRDLRVLADVLRSIGGDGDEPVTRGALRRVVDRSADRVDTYEREADR